MPLHPQRFWLVAFLVAWTVDFLFWGKLAGISFFLFAFLALAGGFLLARWEGRRPAGNSLVLAGLVLVLAAATLLRSEPFSRFINGFLALAFLGLLVRTFRSGGWPRFRVLDYLIAGLDLMVAGLSRPIGLPLAPAGEPGSARKRLARQALPVVRGLLLALPVVILLAALLASADLIFADQVGQLLEHLRVERLGEYFVRLVFILILAYLFTGLYLQALLPARWLSAMPGDEQALPTREQPAAAAQEQPGIAEPAAAADTGEAGVMAAEAAEAAVARADAGPGAAQPAHARGSAGAGFLGAIEAFVILGSVDLLFAFFVAIQFRYMFGGQENITAAGYTFSEYARRGFFELVWVAVISLLLYQALNAVTRRRTAAQARVFTALAFLLVGSVLVILVSAFQRLLLYENAYGFTRLRTYTHVFIPWLGLLLAGTMLFQLARREQWFGGLLLLTAAGFGLSFCVLDVDGLIARQNVARAQAGKSLDGAYLLTLSDDVLPVLVREFQRQGQPERIRDTLGAVLACRVYRTSLEEARPWQAYHPGRTVARQSLAGLDLVDYQVRGTASVVYVPLGGDAQFTCTPSW
jgi:hypothetical protein